MLQPTKGSSAPAWNTFPQFGAAVPKLTYSYCFVCRTEPSDFAASTIPQHAPYKSCASSPFTPDGERRRSPFFTVPQRELHRHPSVISFQNMQCGVEHLARALRHMTAPFRSSALGLLTTLRVSCRELSVCGTLYRRRRSWAATRAGNCRP